MGFWDFINIGSRRKPAAATLQASADEGRSRTPSPEQFWIDMLSGYGIKGPMDVTMAKALTVSAVYACVRIRATTVASLHLGLYKSGRGGGVEEVTDGPEWETVCMEPCALYSSMSWRMAAQAQMDLDGESFSRLWFDGVDKPTAGRIRKIELIRGKVTPKLKDDNLFYEVTYENGGKETLLDYEVLHLKGLTLNGMRGIAPLDAARETLSAALSADRYANDIWDTGVLKGFLEVPHLLKDAQKTELKQSILDVMRNYSESSGIGVLQNGTKFNKVGVSPAETQLLEYKKYINAEVSRYYGVPLHMISDLERATFSNIEHQGIEYNMYTVRPIVKVWEDELNRRVLRKKDRGRLFYRFNMESLLRADTRTRGEFYSKMYNIGAFNLDEIRALENLNPIPGGKGKTHYRPANMLPLGQAKDNTNTQNADAAASAVTDNNQAQNGTA